MSVTIDYYLSPSSPWTYLGHDRFRRMADSAEARINVMPLELSGVFPRTGGLPLPKRAPERQAYRMQELHRWRDYLGMPLNPEPTFFPVTSMPACRLMAAAKKQGDDCLDLSGAILRAVWVEERNIADENELAAIAGAVGLAGPALVEASQSDESAAEVERYAEQAIAAGVFGSPTYIVDGELFWGQDRVDMLAWRLGVN